MGRDARSQPNPPWVVIAGGGTAGHVKPGLAVAEELVARGRDRSAVAFMGAQRGMERELVPAAGFTATLLPLRSFSRPLRPVGVLLAAASLLAGTVRAIGVLRRQRPSVVLSVGGYASVPAVVAAKLLRVPVVVLSYDAVVGRANRLEAKVAAASAVAFESAGLPRQHLTGTPLSAELLRVDRIADRAEARRALGLPLDRFVVLVVGGSLGSGAINDAVRSLVAACADRRDLAVHHVIGARYDDGSWSPRADPGGLIYRPVPFEHHMALAYAACDLLVARAGASTVAEVGALGIPAVLCPWPLSAEDHQRANARTLSDRGGAVLLEDEELSATRLQALIDGYLSDPAALAALGRTAAELGHRGGAAAVVDVLEAVAR